MRIKDGNQGGLRILFARVVFNEAHREHRDLIDRRIRIAFYLAPALLVAASIGLLARQLPSCGAFDLRCYDCSLSLAGPPRDTWAPE